MFTIEVRNCARCGMNHEYVQFFPFINCPPDATHWGTCPNNAEPILMQVQQVATATTGPMTRLEQA